MGVNWRGDDGNAFGDGNAIGDGLSFNETDLDGLTSALVRVISQLGVRA